MSDPTLDPELLAAFLPEFEAGLARLAAAPDTAAAARVLDGLAAMAEALGAGGFTAGFEAVAAALDPFDPAALAAAAAALGAALRALAGPGVGDAPGENSGDQRGDRPPDGPAAAPPQGRPIRTLVVDDSPTMRRLVREVLATDAAFAWVGEAEDGAAALASLPVLAPDLMLLDIEMPRLDGIGVLRAWALRGGAGAVVIVSSAAPPGSPMARELRRLGAAAVVGKPSGALSFDLAARRGAALLAAARRAAGHGA